MKQLLLDIQPPAQPSLSNFVIGRNAEAIHSITDAINGGAQRFIYLWGAAGSGKSHLLASAAELARNNDLTLVIADDVHLLSDEAQINLFNNYNQLRESRGMLIATGIEAPMQMCLRDDLATRLAWGLTYQLHPLTDVEKAQALRTHANQRGMHLPDEVIDYCLRYLRRDLPNLMAILNALDEWSLTTQKPVTVLMLKKLLQLSI